MYEYIWDFFIYAFLGWCAEVSFAALTSGKFVNRGFLNGPLCPIYGFGAVIVLYCLTPLKNNLFLLFVGSVILTSALEWLTGFVLEKLFHERWWDYSDMPFNIGGYICPIFSLMWGFACLFVVKLFHPTVLFLVYLIPHTLGLVLLVILSIVMVVDIIATVHTITGMNRRLNQIDELAAKIKDASNEFGSNLADHVLDAAEKGENLKEDLSDIREDLADLKEERLQRREDRRLDFQMGLGELQEDLGEWKDDLTQRAAEHRADLAEHRAAKRQELEEFRRKMQELLEADGFGQRRMLKAFPKMRSTDHGSALERMRRRMDRR